MNLKRFTGLLLMLVMLCTLSLPLVSCSSSGPVVMEVGEVEINYNLLRYFVKNYMGSSSAEDYGKDEALQQELADNVYSALRQIVACEKIAEEQGIGLNEDDEENIETQIEEIKSTYESEEAYKEMLEAQFGDEDTLRRVLRMSILQNKLYEYLTNEYTNFIKSDDPTVRADIEAGNFFAAEYLFIYCSDEDRSEKRDFAESLHGRIEGGESMLSIKQAHETTYGLRMDYYDLPCFTYTEELQYFEDAVLALKVGELAEVIERSDGFLIVRRNELDQDYIDTNFMSVVKSYIDREYALYMQDYADNLPIEWDSKYEDTKLWEIE